MVKICLVKLLIKSTQILQHRDISWHISKDRLLFVIKGSHLSCLRKFIPFFWEA